MAKTVRVTSWISLHPEGPPSGRGSWGKSGKCETGGSTLWIVRRSCSGCVAWPEISVLSHRVAIALFVPKKWPPVRYERV